MKIWLLEFKKMFLGRKMLLLLIAIFIANGLRLFIFSQENLKHNENKLVYAQEGFEEFESQFIGEITTENALKIKKGYDNYTSGDMRDENYYLFTIYDNYLYQYSYQDIIAEKLQFAEQNIELFNEKGNVNDAKLNQLFISTYEIVLS